MNGLNIVIAEDDAIIKMYLVQLLEGAGHNIVGTAATGKGVIAEVDDNKPDILLLDIGLKGDLDGIETAIVVQKEFSTPLIFISGNSDRLRNEVQHTNIEPVATFVKPIDEQTLLAVLKDFSAEKNNRSE